MEPLFVVAYLAIGLGVKDAAHRDEPILPNGDVTVPLVGSWLIGALWPVAFLKFIGGMAYLWLRGKA